MWRNPRVFSIGILLSLATSFFPVANPVASAEPLKGYETLAVSGGGAITMAPSSQKTVTLEFKNTGTKEWKRTGAAYVSVYTYKPKYRKSAFMDTSWLRQEQPARLTEEKVKPGDVGHVSFTIKAPAKAGTYEEPFKLAADDVAWIPGGDFTLKIKVDSLIPLPTPNPSVAPSGANGDLPNSQTTTSLPAVSASSPPSPVVTKSLEPSDKAISAAILLKSSKQISAAGGSAVAYTVGVKNTGTATWTRREIRVPELQIASLSQMETRDSSWFSPDRALMKSDDKVAPGALDLLSFTFRAPKHIGSYTIRFALAVNDKLVPDGEIDIPVEVTSDSPELLKVERSQAPIEDPNLITPETVNPIAEPMMRVGVLIVDEETNDQVTISCAGAWKLRDETGALLAEMDASKSITAFYKQGKYVFNRGNGLEFSSYAVRFIPNEANAVCTVENFDRRATRGSANADNTFRNVLELHYNSTKDRTWLINELPMEYYLKGLGETSNISHLNFQKALITAARTYGFYHFERATKHDAEFFHVDAYADQVYKGYGQEQRTPRLTQSVDETRGQIVMYKGKTAITPYFSRSDGRTRDWSEVWYGTVDWIKSVPTPCDAGKVLWGHGVGMSASEALCQANNGKSWDDIIHYFYQGIDIIKRWN